jgi:hypothetical protein
MLSLVLATEAFVARHEQELIGDALRAAWRLSGEAARTRGRSAELLCFGDSLVKLGLLPRVLEAELGRPAYNLAVPGAPAAASYYLLRSALDAGARPKALVVDFHSSNLTCPPRKNAHLWSELLTPGAAGDLGWRAHDPRLVTTIGLAMALPSVRRREDLREEIRFALSGQSRPGRAVVATTVRATYANAGATPHRKRVNTPEAPDPMGMEVRWAPYPVNVEYVRRFLDLAAERRIPVFWLVPPVSPARQARDDRRGTSERYTRLIETLRVNHPEVTILDARRSGFEPDRFIDPTHLDEQGAAALSRGVAAAIGPRLRGEKSGHGWVRLPARGGTDDDPATSIAANSSAAPDGSARR